MPAAGQTYLQDVEAATLQCLGLNQNYSNRSTNHHLAALKKVDQNLSHSSQIERFSMKSQFVPQNTWYLKKQNFLFSLTKFESIEGTKKSGTIRYCVSIITTLENLATFTVFPG